jgi:hypothetical protein
MLARRQPSLFGPLVLAAGFCLATAGCTWMPHSDSAPTDPAPWLSSKLGSKAEREALKNNVEADPFPSGPEGGA